VRLRRIESGHYQTHDGTFVVRLSRDSTHWFVAAIRDPGQVPETPVSPTHTATTRRAAAAILAGLLAESFASE